MRPKWNCVVDWTRPCRGCSAPGPHECPYAYLLDPEELAAVGQLSEHPGASRTDDTGQAAGPSA